MGTAGLSCARNLSDSNAGTRPNKMGSSDYLSDFAGALLAFRACLYRQTTDAEARAKLGYI